jgi:hypothetical protein
MMKLLSIHFSDVIRRKFKVITEALLYLGIEGSESMRKQMADGPMIQLWTSV